MTLFISRILRGNCWKVQDTKIVLLLSIPRLFLDLFIIFLGFSYHVAWLRGRGVGAMHFGYDEN